MKLYPRRVIIVVGVLFALGYMSVSPAHAITYGTANSKAAGFQHYVCRHRLTKCGNRDFIPTHCNGPTRGNVQWSCVGTITGMKNGPKICQVYSQWGPYGNLHHGWMDCVPLRYLQNARRW